MLGNNPRVDLSSDTLMTICDPVRRGGNEGFLMLDLRILLSVGREITADEITCLFYNSLVRFFTFECSHFGNFEYSLIWDVDRIWL